MSDAWKKITIPCYDGCLEIDEMILGARMQLKIALEMLRLRLTVRVFKAYSESGKVEYIYICTIQRLHVLAICLLTIPKCVGTRRLRMYAITVYSAG
jgi:hypothetical protein